MNHTVSVLDVWSPWKGCAKVSPGCRKCYVYWLMPRFGNNPSKVRRCKTTFSDPLRWANPCTVLTCSSSDWFIEDADRWRDEAWDIIRRCPQHIFQILTKRPERILDHLPADWPLPNVWLGVSVEDRRLGVPRIDMLRPIPAAARFISFEQLLESLGTLDLRGIHRVIVGGEIGLARPRPMRKEWVDEIYNQAQAVGVAFFFKRWGGSRLDDTEGTWGGRTYRGITWGGYPVAEHALAAACAPRAGGCR